MNRIRRIIYIVVRQDIGDQGRGRGVTLRWNVSDVYKYHPLHSITKKYRLLDKY